MGKKYLIINADDFGVNEETNKAVKELFNDGKITSASLITTAALADEAMTIAKENNFSVGVHLTLNSDYTHTPWRPASDWESVTSLVDEQGFLNPLPLIRKNALSEHVSLECKAQYNMIRAGGVNVDHADSHSGTLYGINGRLFFINAFKFCAEYNLPFRFPINNAFLDDYFNGKAPFYVKLAHKIVLTAAKRYKVKLIDDMITNPHKINVIENYANLENYYLDKLRNIRAGVTELFLHPAYDAPVYNKDKEWLKRIFELEFLYSDKLANLIKDEGIELINYSFLK